MTWPWPWPWPAVACDGPVARAVSAFMVCSAAMIVVNKQVVRIFPLPLTVLWIQMAAATAVLAPYVWKRASLRPWSDALRWARLVPPLFAAMLATGMLALKFASLGAVIVGRNATPLLALPLEAVVLRERPPASGWTWASLVAVLAILLQMHGEKHLTLVRGKNRFSHPTPGGWADGMLNFSVRVLGEGGGAALDFVCELQLIHGKLLTARKEMGGHAVYGGFRCAAELAAFFEAEGAGAVAQLATGLSGGAADQAPGRGKGKSTARPCLKKLDYPRCGRFLDCKFAEG